MLLPHCDAEKFSQVWIHGKRIQKQGQNNTVISSKTKSSNVINNSGEMNTSEGYTCKLLRGSIFMTGPTVLRGRVTSILWFGLRGVRTCSGPAGARPKLKRDKEEKKANMSINCRVCSRSIVSSFNLVKTLYGLLAGLTCFC